MTIRAATAADEAAVFDVNERAFGRPHEGRLVQALTGRIEPCVSLVAELEGTVVGHIFFTRVHLHADAAGAAAAPLPAMGLGPMSVVPSRQKEGIGSELVRAGLDACRGLGERLVFVLGHPDYYPRFGFVRAAAYGIRFEVPVPEEVFLVLELVPGALTGRAGVVRYDPVFSEFDT